MAVTPHYHLSTLLTPVALSSSPVTPKSIIHRGQLPLPLRIEAVLHGAKLAFVSSVAAATIFPLCASAAEPSNALSLPTWAIHVSSVVEWYVEWSPLMNNSVLSIYLSLLIWDMVWKGDSNATGLGVRREIGVRSLERAFMGNGQCSGSRIYKSNLFLNNSCYLSTGTSSRWSFLRLYMAFLL